MLEALSVSLNKAAVLGFVAYILGAAVLFALFQFIYTRLTPHKEFELIRSGLSLIHISEPTRPY